MARLKRQGNDLQLGGLENKVENKLMSQRILSHGQLLQLKRLNTPTVSNGWELITDRDTARECFNLQETVDFMPQMGPMVGYAVTVQIELSDPNHDRRVEHWMDYFRYVSEIPGPKIVVVQDLDKPTVIGSFWGEVSANTLKALGCVGTITDGAVRDLDGMTNAGFKAIARRLAVGHGHPSPIRWGCKVEVFGASVEPGQLIHADKHGFLVVPDEDQAQLVEAAEYFENSEFLTKLFSLRDCCGKTKEQVLATIKSGVEALSDALKKKYGRTNEV